MNSVAGTSPKETNVGPIERVASAAVGGALMYAGLEEVLNGLYGRGLLQHSSRRHNRGVGLRWRRINGTEERVPEHTQKGELDAAFLATHHFSLEDSPESYDMFKHKRDGIIRAVFTV